MRAPAAALAETRAPRMGPDVTGSDVPTRQACPARAHRAGRGLARGGARRLRTGRSYRSIVYLSSAEGFPDGCGDLWIEEKSHFQGTGTNTMVPVGLILV